ncbi:tetratricopeptide repeat protein [Albidovulum sp.]
MIWGLILCLPALGLVLWPLIRGRAAVLGRGAEDDSPLQRWEAERARLIAQIRDNDIALAERRLDAETHRANAARLGAEAEAALAALRGARAELAGDGIAPRERPHPLAMLAAAAAVLAVAAAAGTFARLQDIDLTGSPHADGRIPIDVAGVPATPPAMGLPPPAAGAGPVIGADGTPDIGAMVARLEARVAEGDAPPEDIAMLLRSYDTLGRIADAREVLVGALARFPDNPDFQIGYLRAVINEPEGADLDLALAAADRLIAAMPGLMEARWYRSLILMRLGRPDEAERELMWMTPQLPADSPAGRAVRDLLAQLETDR